MVYKSGLGFLFRGPEVPFVVPPKSQISPDICDLGRHIISANAYPHLHRNPVDHVPHHLLAVRDAQEEVRQGDAIPDEPRGGKGDSMESVGGCNDCERPIPDD